MGTQQYWNPPQAGSGSSESLYAHGNVKPNNATISATGATISATGAGVWDVVFDAAMLSTNYTIVLSAERHTTNSDHQIEYFDVALSGFSVRSSLQDDGAGSGTLINGGWSFVVPTNTIAPSLNSVDVTVPDGGFVETAISYTSFINCWANFAPVGSVLPATGTIDPTNVSTQDPNLINGNLSDLCYNNSSAGSANKPLPAIDLGSVQSVSQIDLYWWNSTYIATNYNIQASNDGLAWTNVQSGLSASSAGLQPVSVSGSFRYWRMFCVVGNNATWVVLSEMQARAPSTQGLYHFSSVSGVFLTVSGSGNVIINNNSGQSIDFEVVHV